MANASELEVRNLRFDVDADIPRYWHGQGRAVTAFFNNLSVFFPPGERFFIASVKAHRDAVTEPQLLSEVNAFCAQEGIHSREHVRYNRMLEEQGYAIAAMEGRIDRLLGAVSRRLTKRRRLAVTCALEHFTALMGDGLLSKPAVLAGANPVMAALWRWHAAEENEHKAVAFDVYRAAGGNYFERVTAMIGATLIFWAKVVEQQIRLMWSDRMLFSLREWTSLLRFLFVDPGGLRGLLRPYLQYYRPSFHPWDHDNRELLEAWKAELETAEEYLRAA
jgi:predicted metal-dependent hydrolase